MRPGPWFVLRTFLEGKFFTVFSTLFGAGLTIQWLRAHERGRSFAPMSLRRLGFLMVLGLAHGWLMWYGDILFIYSLCGLVLLIPLHFRWSARVQMVVACGALVTGSLAWAGLSLLSAAGRSVEASHIEVGVPATAGPSELVAPVAGGPAVAESKTQGAATTARA